MDQTTTRRRLVTRSAIGIPALIATALPGGIGTGATARAQESTPTADDAVGESGAPAWVFRVRQLMDPYTGSISRPANPPADTRYVAAEVVIDNQSTLSMEFATGDIHLKEESGFEYAAGSVVGEEPRLVSQNLPDGERTRGWVWFTVPADAVLAEIRLYAPPPVMRVPLL